MKLWLPSGRRVEVDPRKGEAAAHEQHEQGERLFFAAEEAIRRSVREPGGEAVDVGALALGDFHALRAVLTRLGVLGEEEIAIHCRNCGKTLRCRPCAGFALGPLQDDELHDPELDATLPFDVPHAIPPVRLLGGRAGDVTLRSLTVAEAAPFHAALARSPLTITADVVRGMGIAALGDETRAPRIARALGRATEESWQAVAGCFLDAHYPPRLFAVVPCPHCGARNDVDAPFDRELEPASTGLSREETQDSNADSFASFDEFDAAASQMAAEIAQARGIDGVTFVVEAGVAACDDGGEPLLGAYVPGDPGDASHPSRAPEVTVYFRTFRAIHEEEGPYDWRAELRETLEHELDHHAAALAGDDPVDDEERREIADEAARVHGKKAIVRGELTAFGADVGGFLARTWPIWLLLLLAIVLATLGEVR